MKLPKPGKPHAQLDRLSGEWDGEETWHPGPLAPEGAQAKGAFEFKKDVDGFYLLADYDEKIEGKPGIRGHGVLGWDPKRESYTLHWFDNFGTRRRSPAAATGRATASCSRTAPASTAAAPSSSSRATTL